jgi:hypothetical protein
MSKKTKTLPPYSGPMIPNDASVLINRPSLWSNCTGTVVSSDPKTGLHRIHITAKDQEAYPGGFHADVAGTFLQVLTADDLLA